MENGFKKPAGFDSSRVQLSHEDSGAFAMLQSMELDLVETKYKQIEIENMFTEKQKELHQIMVHIADAEEENNFLEIEKLKNQEAHLLDEISNTVLRQRINLNNKSIDLEKDISNIKHKHNL
ncbi:MAG: hypothetical protein ACPGTS_00435 [Minisyncoccia bacterium]